MSGSSNPLSYAPSRIPRDPPRLWEWRAIWRLSCLAWVVATGLIVLYGFTRWGVLETFGIFYYLGMAGAGLAMLIWGTIYCIRAWRANFVAPATMRRSVLAMVLPLLNVPIAWICLTAGLVIHGLPFDVEIRNVGATAVARVELSATSRLQTGPIHPGQSAWLRNDFRGEDGPVVIEVWDSTGRHQSTQLLTYVGMGWQPGVWIEIDGDQAKLMK